MQYKVQAESELDKNGFKKTYDIFSNEHKKTIQHALHIHSYYETILLLDGCLYVQIGDKKTLRLSAGDLIFIPPNVIHDTYIDAESNAIMRSIVVKFSPLFLYPMETTSSDISCLLVSPSFHDDCYVFRQGDEQTQTLADTMRKILVEQQSKQFGYELSLRGLLTTLYIGLIRACTKKETKIASPNEDVDEDSAQKLHRILVYLHENYQYKISMQEVADACDMNYFHFSRFFKQITNRNFNEYLLETRINAAQKILLQNEKSISEIALECGFEYVSYFIQKFKQKNGITPREYQKRYSTFVPPTTEAPPHKP